MRLPSPGYRAPSANRPTLRPYFTGAGRCNIVRPSLTVYGQGKAGSSGVSCLAAVQAEEVVEYDVVIERFPAPSAGSFLPDKRSFREEHRVRGYEVSPDQRATIVTIANLLQEVAGNHAVGMWGRTDEGFANVSDMKDLLFVMTRLQVRMFEYPRWGDIVALETYFTEEGRLAFRRDWRVVDAATGKQLGAATSTWVTINTATRRLAKVPDALRKRFSPFSPLSTTHVLLPEETKKKLPEMQLPGQVQGPQQVARRNDMDMNGHINNVTYLAWTLESVPEDVYNTHQVYEIEMDFKAECKAGNTVEAHCNPLGAWHGPSAPQEPHHNGNGTIGNGVNGKGVNGSSHSNGVPPQGQHQQTEEEGGLPQFLHVLQKCNDGSCTELVRARTTWRKDPARRLA